MKNKYLILFILISIFFVMPKNTFAYSVSDYENRNLCGNFELASFKSNGQIEFKSCHNTFDEARNAMKTAGNDDLAIMTKVGGKIKIVDANVALLDLSVNPETLTYFFSNSNLSGSSYTYMDTGSLYGGVDGVHLDSAYNGNNYVAKVKIGNYSGWIYENTYEIVPITWIKSYSTYTVTNDSIRHNYVAKIQNTYNGSAGSTIGPKPEMLNVGTYISYDGHYFYNDLTKLIKDNKAGNYNNSVNKDKPYYNYYMYLSNHTRTTYSSINIDEYIRNNMKITMDVYGNDDDGYSSRLYGTGTFFYYAQEKYGVNAALALSLSRNETGNGRSDLSINKNNGFGLNAVDSNPSQAANWYASFPASILGYADRWITRGYAHPRDWRYFGPQFGDKLLGMNVKYASDTYWSEKMAGNYYALDKAKGLQDYNYYQLGIVNGPTDAYSNATTSSKWIYKYPEAGDGVVVVGEKNNWYEVVSDLNVDNNYNEQSGDYNWNKTVFIPKSSVTLINKGKNGFISPNEVTEYQDSEYEYDLMVQNTEFKPIVGLSTKKTNFYYDSTLQSKKNQVLEKNRYVMIYSIAYDKNNNAVAYLVSSDHKYNQKHWVSADSILKTSKAYGKAVVSVSGNQYTWVNSNTQDVYDTLISGLYTNNYIPVLEERVVDGNKWYKVPVDISGTTNEFGWTLASAPGVEIKLYGSINSNNFPVITANNTSIVQGTNFNALSNVKATDVEDGDITNKIKVRSNNLDINKVGKYTITYEVTDSSNLTSTKSITVEVIKNEYPTINAKDVEIYIGEEVKVNVTATDKEDGDITKNIKTVKNTVNNKVEGVYEITYEVTDSYNQKTTKTIKVTVMKDAQPVINAKDKQVELNKEFNALSNVTATDKEDGDITKNLKVVENTVDTKTLGTYKVTYEVVDSKNNKTTKTIKVEVVEEKDITSMDNVEGTFHFDSLKKDNGKLILKGYQTIQGINNTLDTDITYQLIFENINNSTEKVIKANRLTENVKRVYSPDGKDYTYSWFSATIDVDDLDIGNYKMYIVAKTSDIYSKSLVVNKTYNEQATYVKSNKNNATISNNYSTQNAFVELRVRNEVLVEKNGSYVYNQYDKYTKFEFTNDNKLYLRGNSYSYGMDLSTNAKVERKIVFENTKDYKTYTKDLGSITTGNYNVVLPVSDNLDKTRSWYDAKIDLSDIPEGTYVIYIYTKSNINDIYEFTEKLGRSLDNVTRIINNKKYSFTINTSRGNRIEMVVTR